MTVQTWEQECLPQLQVRNNTGDIAIIVLWNLPEHTVLPVLGDGYDRVSVVGNLRTPLGVSWFLRGLGQLPYITTVVVWGDDLTRTGEALFTLWKLGVGKNHTIPEFGWQLDQLIPKRCIDQLSQKVSLVDTRNYTSERLPDILESLVVNRSSRHKATFPPVVLPERTILPHRGPIHLIASDPTNGWVGVMQTILLTGRVRKTRKQEKLRHIFGVSVTFPVPEKEVVAPPFPFSLADLDVYYNDMIKDEPPPKGVDYRYGHRMQKGHNQLRWVIDLLRRSPDTKRAVIVLLDQTDLATLKDAPCVAMITLSIVAGKLHSSCIIRSNDMYGGWPFNVLSLLRVQRLIAQKVGVGLGTMHVLSQNAQIYEGVRAQAQRVVDEWGAKPEQFPADYAFSEDPAGNFVFKVKDGGVEVRLMSPRGDEVVMSEWSASPSELIGWLVAIMPWLLPQHIRYLGKEEEKLWRSLATGEPYVQG